MSEKDTTHFGYREVEKDAKAGMVADVFHSVAARYDLMNDLMSGGIHRIWKRFAIELSGVRKGNSVLDIAGGTGDLHACCEGAQQATDCAGDVVQRRVDFDDTRGVVVKR